MKLLYYLNQSTDDPWHWIFMALYIVLTASALVSNSLLLLGVKCVHSNMRNREAQSSTHVNIRARQTKPCEMTRDMLISYLATLDIFLSLTIPFSALDGLSKFWPLGTNTELLCRATKASPSFVVYSSSMVIMLIATNFYRQIVYPYKRQISPSNLKYVMSFIIVFSLCLSFPQFYYTKIIQPPLSLKNVSQINQNKTFSDSNFGNVSSVESNSTFEHDLPAAENTNETLGYDQNEGDVDDCTHLNEQGWNHVVFCIEDWPFGEDSLDAYGRLYYTLLTFSIQLVVPLIVISFCYFRIYSKLSKQDIVRRSLLNLHDAARLRRTEIRCKRRNQKMLAISLVYLISWFPLGIISILLDYKPFIFGSNTAHVAAIFVTCHLIGMLSASLNPVIYGYKNKEVRKGNLKDILVLSFKKKLRWMFFKVFPNHVIGIFFRAGKNRMHHCNCIKIQSCT